MDAGSAEDVCQADALRVARGADEVTARRWRSLRRMRRAGWVTALGACTAVAVACSSSTSTGDGAPASSGPPAVTSTVPTSTVPTTAPTSSVAASSTSPQPSAPRAVTLPGSVAISSLTWPTADVAWALGGGELLHTTNAGASWTATPSPLVSDDDQDDQVVFADATNGWIVGDGGLRSTHDGGATWAAPDLPGGITIGAAVAAASGTVHVAYLGAASGLSIASSPIDHDAFALDPVTIPFGAGPVLHASMSAGGPYGELIYTDRTFVGAAEIRDGRWATWDLACPYDGAVVAAGLSPQGKALAVACGPSGFGDAAPVVGADLTGGAIAWTTIEPAGDPAAGLPTVDVVTATDAGTRIVVLTKPDGSAEIASSTDGGASWSSRTPLPAGTAPLAIAHLPDGGLVLTTDPQGGLSSPDGLTWTPVATTP